MRQSVELSISQTPVGPFAFKSSKGKARRHQAHLHDPERVIAEGEEADRRSFSLNPNQEFSIRPLSDAELRALLRRRELQPPPGISQPRLYAVLDATFDPEDRQIRRDVCLVSKRVWDRYVQDTCCGLKTPYDPTQLDYRSLYHDAISADRRRAAS